MSVRATGEQAPHLERSTTPPTAARALVAALVSHGVDRVFCVAGESYLAVLDALGQEPRIDVVTNRHEGSAGFAALADAKLTRRPGVLLVNRGPGATNASIAVHSARQDATPLVLLVGHVRRTEIGRAAFQEMDYQSFFGGTAKGVWTVLDPMRTAEVVARALRSAQAGTPGPTVVVLPEDLLSEPAAAAPAQPWHPPRPGCDPAQVRATVELLRGARRPLLLAGDRLGDDRGRRALRDAARGLGLPVAVSNKRQDLLDNDDPRYAGHLNIATQPARRALLDEADLVLAVGTRMDSVTTQSFVLPGPGRQRLVHVYPDGEQLGHVYTPELAVDADPATFLDALTAAAPPDLDWAEWTGRLRQHETQLAHWHPAEAADGVPFGAVVAALDELLDDAVCTVDAGNFTSWVHRYLRMVRGRRMLGVASSAMGFGVPAAVAAALRHPDRQAVAFVGDGGFLMTGTELATAVAHRTRLLVVIADNGSYGTIRQHQERQYPGRQVATDLTNPDFAAMAWSFGATGLTIRCLDDVPRVLGVALDCPGPVVVHVETSLAWISAYQHLPGIAAAHSSTAAGEQEDAR